MTNRASIKLAPARSLGRKWRDADGSGDAFGAENRSGVVSKGRRVDMMPTMPLAADRGNGRIAAELRKLIGEMSRANHLWGAPHIYGELLKLGFTLA
jgi:hypothetical protein